MTILGDTLDTGDIARELNLSREYVTDKLTKKVDFPKPVFNRSSRLRRWAREDIRKWAVGPH